MGRDQARAHDRPVAERARQVRKPTAAQQRRLEAGITRRALPGHQSGGVLLVPPIAPLDEWEAEAMASQAELARLTREGVDDRARGGHEPR